MTELWIPAERLRQIVDRHQGTVKQYPAAVTRRLFDIRNERVQYVSLTVADRLLIELGLEHWLRVPLEQGGLADIYVEEKQYGRPPTARTKDVVPMEERSEKIRRKREWAAEPIPVQCPRCGTVRKMRRDSALRSKVTMCRACSARNMTQVRMKLREAA